MSSPAAMPRRRPEWMAPLGPAQCRKKAYPNRDAAERALESCWRNRRRTRIESRTYQCPRHNHEVWHLTSKPLPDKESAA